MIKHKNPIGIHSCTRVTVSNKYHLQLYYSSCTATQLYCYMIVVTRGILRRAAVVCGGRARGRAPLGGAARVPWGPIHGLGRVRSGVVGPRGRSAATGRGEVLQEHFQYRYEIGLGSR